MTSRRNDILLKLIVVVLSIIVLVIMLKIVLGKELIIDKFAYNFLVETMRSDKLTVFMKVITKFSDTIFITMLAICLAVIFLKVIKNKYLAYLIWGNLASVALINQILKSIFKRQRPTGYRLIEMGGYSFPSGHAMVSMAFYGLLIYIIFKMVKARKVRNILIVLNIVIIVLIGISRVYLGVHYFSDVIVGYSLSIIYLIVLTRKLNKKSIFPK